AAIMAADKASDKKAAAATSVDSGTFGIVINGKRVATETFHVDQRSDGSNITAELRFEDASIKAVQNSEMTMNAGGVLKKYVWQEVQPGKARIVIEPQDDHFMITRVFENGGDNSKDTVHPLSAETSIMDDNFYSHIQVLAWKYMALGCQ